MIRVGINGFGRIGRSFLRALLHDVSAQDSIEVAVINIGPSDMNQVAHMFTYDSFMGTLPFAVDVCDGYLCVEQMKIKLVAALDPADIDWGQYDVDWVVDATGKFTHAQKAQQHRDAGAKKVLISAPGKEVDVTIVPGVNDDWYDADTHHIVSLASCTTNALAPVVKLLHEEFRVKTGFLNTIHSYTNRQVLMDVEAKDLRRARGAAVNIIPTTSGAPGLLGYLLPDLDGCLSGLSTRVPVGKVSMIDFAFTTEHNLSIEGINHIFHQAAQNRLKGIVDATDIPLVSIDYTNNPHSVVMDLLLTDACGTHGKVFGWYDNEYGYANRLKDFLVSVNL